MTGEVVRIDDGAVDFCTFSLDAFWSGEEGNGRACRNFFGIFCKGMDGGLADVVYVCHGKERWRTSRFLIDVEIDILEIGEILYGSAAKLSVFPSMVP